MSRELKNPGIKEALLQAKLCLPGYDAEKTISF